ncbi:hypothetical protein EG68_10172 [Paragonimus skrjabini miyazakii]|uniref:Uncharacterized protein n=1 Tax=Paragonimus skrjabini miyazakii TaxID=59628 RepID=A0A8S9YKD8_9TREM|nr:hypothetical protein EG68_10172 [Paragonimus skrjabini miyazakii]
MRDMCAKLKQASGTDADIRQKLSRRSIRGSDFSGQQMEGLLLHILSYAWNKSNTFQRHRTPYEHCQFLVSPVLDFAHYFYIENYCSSYICSTTNW